MSQEKRIAVREKTLNLSFDHKIKHAKNAVGRLINFMVDVGLDDKQIVEMLKSDDDGKYPKGLEPERFDVVSTHSRPKAAGASSANACPPMRVSTHSRPKAAGCKNRCN